MQVRHYAYLTRPTPLEPYEDRLFSLRPKESDAPRCHIPFGDLAPLLSVGTALEFEAILRPLAGRLPFETSSWPSFDEYVEFGDRVEIGPFTYQLQYCERGQYEVRQSCESAVDLAYHVLRIVSPGFSPSARLASQGLDRLEDQRVFLWLRMSSEIHDAYLANEQFGARRLIANVSWMCQELVRMGLADNPAEAFQNEGHIVFGLTLSGMPRDFASALYRDLRVGVARV